MEIGPSFRASTKRPEYVQTQEEKMDGQGVQTNERERKEGWIAVRAGFVSEDHSSPVCDVSGLLL